MMYFIILWDYCLSIFREYYGVDIGIFYGIPLTNNMFKKDNLVASLLYLMRVESSFNYNRDSTHLKCQGYD